jgi:hypothetical protein
MARDNIDIVGILKWASEQRNQIQTPPKRGFRQYREPRNPMDKLFADFLEDQLRTKFQEMDEQLKKKEKKPEPSWWDKQSFIQKIAVLTMTVPLTMMGMIILILEFVKVIKAM